MTSLPRRTVLALTLPVLLIAGACTTTTGGAGATASTLVEPSTAASAPASAPASSAPTTSAAPTTGGGGKGGGDYDYGTGSGASATPVGSLTIAIATTAAGDTLTDGSGMTLYIFTNDSANSSACEASCADAWPPLTVPAGEAPTAGAGVTGTFTTFQRADGTTQVAYGGKPLYTFSGDSAAGDSNGEGVGGNWFIAAP